MYSKIFNPTTNRSVNINSNLGKQILYNYLVLSTGGANKEINRPLPGHPATARGCTKYRKNIEPICGKEDSSHCKWYKGIGCYPEQDDGQEIAARTKRELINEQQLTNEIFNNQIDICEARYQERDDEDASWTTIEVADEKCGVCPYTNAGNTRLIDEDKTTCAEIGNLCYSEGCGDKNLFLNNKSKIVKEDNIYLIEPEGEVCFGDTITECIAITLVFEGNWKIAAHINPSDFVSTIEKISHRKTKINGHNLLYWIKKKVKKLEKTLKTPPILTKVLIFSAQGVYPKSSPETMHPFDISINLLEREEKGEEKKYWVITTNNFAPNIFAPDEETGKARSDFIDFNTDIHKTNDLITDNDKYEFGVNLLDNPQNFAEALGTILGLNNKNIDIEFRYGEVVRDPRAPWCRQIGVIMDGRSVAPCLLVRANGTWNIP
jgi:hypothetical protein